MQIWRCSLIVTVPGEEECKLWLSLLVPGEGYTVCGGCKCGKCCAWSRRSLGLIGSVNFDWGFVCSLNKILRLLK